VYYAATDGGRSSCADEEIAVVGAQTPRPGGHVPRAKTAKRCTCSFAVTALAQTMSRYLISGSKPSRSSYTRARRSWSGRNGHSTGSVGTGRTDRWRSKHSPRVHHDRGLKPSKKVARGCLALDQKGFIKTGAALTPMNLCHREVAAAPRAAPLLETRSLQVSSRRRRCAAAAPSASRRPWARAPSRLRVVHRSWPSRPPFQQTRL